ncbi:MAG TPA: hypothetical protein VMU04_22330 [Candidatus Acidoferrum sp.]|nr:hypothetical protein [Candidatus Acidoferrum sp.]
MPHKVQYDAAQEIIVLTYSGHVTIEEVREATVEAIAIQKQGLTNCVLIDPSDMTAWPSPVEMYYLVESYRELEVPAGTRLAALRPKLSDESNLTRFYETVCQNRGYNAVAFDNREDAERWLRSAVPWRHKVQDGNIKPPS